MAFAAVVTPLEVYAQNTNLGVTILQVTPSTATGQWVSSVNVQGTQSYQQTVPTKFFWVKPSLHSGKCSRLLC